MNHSCECTLVFKQTKTLYTRSERHHIHWSSGYRLTQRHSTRSTNKIPALTKTGRRCIGPATKIYEERMLLGCADTVLPAAWFVRRCRRAERKWSADAILMVLHPTSKDLMCLSHGELCEEDEYSLWVGCIHKTIPNIYIYIYRYSREAQAGNTTFSKSINGGVLRFSFSNFEVQFPRRWRNILYRWNMPNL